jgi:hypothetical protein
MATPRPGSLGRGVHRLLPAALAALLVVFFLLPAATQAAPSSTASSVRAASDPALAATVTWNGANILNYTAPTAAARIGFNGVVDVHYAWHSTGGLLVTYTINDARLQIFYFGFALATRDVVNSAVGPAASGNFTMNWSTGALQYILEGSYKLVASLLAPNGTTMWSQSFWVFVAAPYDVAALLPIVLILLIVWEVYNLATVGRQAGLGKRPPATPPGSAPTDTSAQAGSETEPTTAPSADGPPPDSGGSS